MNIDLSLRYVRDWMIDSPVITPRTRIATALRLLREHGLSALPVWDEGRLVGLAHETDLLRLTPSEAHTPDWSVHVGGIASRCGRRDHSWAVARAF